MGLKMRTYTKILFIFLLITGYALSVQAQNYSWKKMDGPYGNDITSLSIVGSSRVYASTRNNGIGMSEDMGMHWSEQSDIQFSQLNDALETDQGTLLLAGDAGTVLRSTDNGKNWDNIDVDTYVSDEYSITEDTSSGMIYLGTDTGIYQSDDDGQTWTNIGLNSRTLVTKVVIDESGDIIAITNRNYLPHSGIANTPSAVNVSSDGGTKWDSYSTPGTNGISDFVIDDAGNWYISVYGDGVYKSDNQGKGWSKIGMDQKNVVPLVVDSSGTLLVGFDDGLRKYDSGTASFISAGLSGVEVRTIAIAQDGSWIVGTVDFNNEGKPAEIYRSDDAGMNWKAVGTHTVKPQSLVLNDRGDMYVGSKNFGLYQSGDLGGSWKRKFVVPNHQDVKALQAGPDGYMILSAQDASQGNQRLYYSADYGDSWNEASVEGLTDIYANQFLYLDKKTVWAAMPDDFQLNDNGGIYASTDTGKTWKPFALNGKMLVSLNKTSYGIFAGSMNGASFTDDYGQNWSSVSGLSTYAVFDILKTDSGTLIAATAKGFKRSTDGGTKWDDVTNVVSSEFPSRTADQIDIRILTENDSGILIAGTKSSGLFVSDDDGQTWTSMNTGFDSHVAFGDNFSTVSGLVTDINGNVYAASDFDGGVFKLESHATPIQKQEQRRPTTFSLGQNYPNPFNPTTNIPIRLAQSGKVKLTVFDVLGRRVATLVDGNMRAGIHQVAFDARRLSSGIYFYRLVAGTHVMTRKMLLLK